MNLGIKNIWQSGAGGNLTNVAKTNETNTFTQPQNINAQLNINSGGEPLKINANGAKYISFYEGSTRQFYFGRPSSSNSDIEIKNLLNNGNILLNVSGNGKVKCGSIETYPSSNIKALDMSLGYGGQASLIPDEGTNKSLNFNKGNVRFASLNFNNQTKLINLPNIVNTTSNSLSNNASQTLNLRAGSIILMVRRSDTGGSHQTWVMKNNGEFTITNNTGGARQFLITYWEV